MKLADLWHTIKKAVRAARGTVFHIAIKTTEWS